MSKTDKVIGIATYNINDWKRLLELSDDREFLESTWEEWNDNFHIYSDELIKQNIQFKEILIDLDDLEKFCKLNKLKVDGNSRSQFTTYILMQLSK